MKTSTLLLTSVLSLLLFSSCQEWRNCPRAKGDILTEDRQVQNFERIAMRASGDVYITVDPTVDAPEVSIKTHESIMENVKTRVLGERLVIETDPCIRKLKTLNVYIVCSDLSEITVDGSADIHGQNTFVLDDLKLNINGSGNMDLDLELEDVEANISGSGDIALKGTGQRADFSVSGSGNISAYGLSLEECFIDIAGSGDCRVDVSDYLSVDISGSGDVTYQGQPKVDADINGSGEVEAF